MQVGVLLGGDSKEREISLRSGKRVVEALRKKGYKVIEIDPIEVDFLEKLKKIEVAYLVLHGGKGENGCIQGLLEFLGIPYTGSGVLGSALGMNKIAAKRIMQSCSIPTPKFFHFSKNPKEEELNQAIKEVNGFPLVIKPTSEGSSIGVFIIYNMEELKGKIKNNLEEFGDVFVEEYIEGMQATVGVIGDEENPRALPIIELLPKYSKFYDYYSKYTKGATELIIPARLKEDVYKKAQQVAIKTHRVLCCFGVSRVDMIIKKDQTPYVTEINTLPGMTELSDLPAAAAADGMSYEDLVEEILKLALKKKNK